jgi:1-acyl-sn-glycerol-3-phosphate acyltransferase
VTVPLPSRWVRRLLLDPLVWFFGFWLLVLALPYLVLLLLVLSFVLPGKWRLLRITGFAIVYLVLEVVLMPIALGAWVLAGFGRSLGEPHWIEFHYRVLDYALRLLFWFGSRQFSLTVTTDGPALPGDDNDPTTTEHPLLVLSRHGGPGDSFLLVHEILSWSGRRPRIVLKDTLQLDPMIDIYLNRVPTRFLDPRSMTQGASLAAIAELAATMRRNDALLIFPEGANVTPRRRLRAIERLRASGRMEAAQRAERIVHLMPPRPGGVHAALIANPDVHVVVVAHTGLDRLATVGDIWREVPMAKALHLRWDAVPASEVPTSQDGIADWLLDEWEQMDAWVDSHQRRADPADQW